MFSLAHSGSRSRPTSQPQLIPAMAELSDEQLRALLLLARSPKGCTEALLMAHGFESAMLGQLVLDGLARAEVHDMKIARRRVTVAWVHITEAGRKAAADN
jgi:hypothetical protein